MDIKPDSRANNDTFRFSQYSPHASLGFLLKPFAERVTSTVKTICRKAIELNQQRRCDRCKQLIDDVN